MNFTEDQLRAQGYVIEGGRAVKRSSLNVAEAHAAFEQLQQTVTKSKYRNKRCLWNGEWFDSQAERDWFMTLKAREAAGEISELRRQVSYPLYAPLMVNGQVNGVTQISAYVADAVWVERGQTVVADRKSKATKTSTFKLKAHWLNAQDGIIIQVVE